MQNAPGDVTRLLQAWSDGDERALDHLVPIVYEELRRLASYYLRTERSGHTLQTTALVHEAYLRLADRPRVSLEGRDQFMAVAAQAMRRILVDHARRRRSRKRSQPPSEELPDATVMALDQPADLLDLDRALEELTQLDERQGRVVELRYFGGLSIEEVSRVLGVTSRTVKRDWRSARAWLFERLAPASGSPSAGAS